MRKFLVLIGFILTLPIISAAQSGVRFGDGQPIWSAARVSGPILSVPNSTIQICNAPNVGVPCTNLATTYTDSSLGTNCPSNKQVVLAGTNTCQATTDQFGNWGVWVAPGQYTYTLTTTGGQSFGPIPFTAASGTGGGGGGSITLQTNGINNLSQVFLNFQDSGVFTWSNPVLGTEQVNFLSEPPNSFLASPNGSIGVPSARLIVPADIPAGTLCGTNFFANGLNAGLVTACIQPAFSNLAGTISLGQTVLTTNGDLLSVSGGVLARVPAASSSDFFLQGASLAIPSWGAWINCGDATHALGYSTTTHAVFCQALSGTGGGSTILQTNGINNASQTTLNFQNAGVLVWSNPSTGNEQVNFATQSANSFIAAPNGVAGVPSARLIVAADIPAGTTCATNFFDTGLQASLVPTCVQPSFSNLTGTISLTQTALTTNGDLLTVSGGVLARLPSAVSQDFVLQGASAAAPVWLAINNCGSSSQALSYSTTSHTFGCQTISAGSGTINNAQQFSIAYYSAVGTTNTISGAAPPTTPNVPYIFTSTPSGGVAQAPVWTLPGIPINAQTSTNYTVLATDRENLITLSNAGAISVTLPQAGTSGFTNNFNFAVNTINVGLVTVTPNSPSTINGNASQIVPDNWFAFIYSDNSNYRAGILPSIAAFPSCASGALGFTTATGVFGCNTFATLAPTPTRAGDVIYWNGSTWVTLAGNNSGTNCFQENAGGAPSWAACGSGGSSALSAITAATGSNTIANGANGLQVWNWALTANQDAFEFGETTAATSGTLGNQYILEVATLSGSTAVPFGVTNSLSGSQTLPSLHITPTWNTTGVVDAAILVNVTNTASGTASLLEDLQIGGTSKWSLDKAGNELVTNSVGVGATPPACTAGTSGALCFNEGTAFTNVSGAAGFYADSTQHEFFAKTNGASSAGMIVRAQPGSIHSTANTGAISTATLCASSAGACNTSGQYNVKWAFIETGTACGTPGSGGVTFLLTWTDFNGTSHSAVSLAMDDASAITSLSQTFHFQTALGTAWASGDFNINSNGSVIQYATGYVACSAGTGTYELDAIVTRVQ